mmetsp:Transcript_94551/g.276289  ORF Transcript_94551/g.276289 Transcript_94551/m.276289 type:complete len:205 (+) Transcript_94551:2855-3469(+)
MSAAGIPAAPDGHGSVFPCSPRCCPPASSLSAVGRPKEVPRRPCQLQGAGQAREPGPGPPGAARGQGARGPRPRGRGPRGAARRDPRDAEHADGRECQVARGEREAASGNRETQGGEPAFAHRTCCQGRGPPLVEARTQGDGSCECSLLGTTARILETGGREPRARRGRRGRGRGRRRRGPEQGRAGGAAALRAAVALLGGRAI